MRWLGLISMVCFTLSYLPQLMRTYRTRNVEGLSTAYWIIVIIGYISGLLYVAPLRDGVLLWTYSLGGACAVAMLVGCLAFRRSE